jgi:hypothetical protein
MSPRLQLFQWHSLAQTLFFDALHELLERGELRCRPRHRQPPDADNWSNYRRQGRVRADADGLPVRQGLTEAIRMIHAVTHVRDLPLRIPTVPLKNGPHQGCVVKKCVRDGLGLEPRGDEKSRHSHAVPVEEPTLIRRPSQRLQWIDVEPYIIRCLSAAFTNLRGFGCRRCEGCRPRSFKS